MERAGWPDDLVELLWWCYEAELDPEVAVACRRSSDELVEACGGDGGPSPPFHVQMAGVGVEENNSLSSLICDSHQRWLSLFEVAKASRR